MACVNSDVRASEASTRPIGEVITRRGKELRADDTVSAARQLFANESVRVVPVIDGSSYVGAVDRDTIAGAATSATMGSVASALVPTATAATPTADALADLDRHGTRRLVVLDDDGVTYVGLVCVRSDGEQLCIDAECQPPPTT